MSQVVTCPRCQLLVVNEQHELLTPQDGLRFVVMHYKVDGDFIQWVTQQAGAARIISQRQGLDPARGE